MTFQRIVTGHGIMAGVPRIRRTRIPVATSVSLVAESTIIGEILAGHPQLSAE